MTPDRPVVEVDGRELTLSNLDKVLYPTAGFTKGEVIDYYRRIAPAILPHLARRALTLRRFPHGVDGTSFFEKRCPQHRPPWVPTAEVQVRRSEPAIEHCVVDDLPTLVWVANLASLELHVPLATVDDVDHPVALVFDLDPGPPAGLTDCAAVALDLRAVLDGLGLAAFPKLSGGKGLHVYVPLNPSRPDAAVTHEQARRFAHAVAELLARRQPERVVTRMAKPLRTGRVFVDWSQNARYKTTVAPWSLRAEPRPSVAVPLTWDEVEAAAAPPHEALVVEAPEALARFERGGDPLAPVLHLEQRLPEAATGAGGRV